MDRKHVFQLGVQENNLVLILTIIIKWTEFFFVWQFIKYSIHELDPNETESVHHSRYKLRFQNTVTIQ